MHTVQNVTSALLPLDWLWLSPAVVSRVSGKVAMLGCKIHHSIPPRPPHAARTWQTLRWWLQCAQLSMGDSWVTRHATGLFGSTTFFKGWCESFWDTSCGTVVCQSAVLLVKPVKSCWQRKVLVLLLHCSLMKQDPIGSTVSSFFPPQNGGQGSFRLHGAHKTAKADQ